MLPKNLTPNATRMRRMMDAVRARGVEDARVLEALARVPRELFVSRALAVDAYDDVTLPIGEQQTISMPSVVGFMTQSLGLKGTEKVLEIGTGCGYQTALLCRLARRVYTIERLDRLSKTAQERLTHMGHTNFVAMVGDGTLGWPAQAPFEAIMVTAAGPKVPPALVAQLAVGGRLVIPVGPTETDQRLLRITKTSDTSTREEVLGKVVFVPLVGVQGVAASK
ncbi:MAG: protein-L-isoaspartate(D-aspartate) O-methyltransferase [Alphaproteobacteria bacterium]